MMLWCELHNTSGIKGGGITNFDPTEYEKDLAWLQTVSQASTPALHCHEHPAFLHQERSPALGPQSTWKEWPGLQTLSWAILSLC